MNTSKSNLPKLATLVPAVLASTASLSLLGQDGGSTETPFKTMQIDDRGFGMTAGWYSIPSDWNMNYELATNPTTNLPIRNRLDFTGPNGELIRQLPHQQYMAMQGTDFQSALRAMIEGGLNGVVTQISLGDFEPDLLVQKLCSSEPSYRNIINGGGRVECLKASLSGSGGGTSYRGLLRITHVTGGYNQNGWGVVSGGCAIASEQRADATLAIWDAIVKGFRPNAEYKRAREQAQAGALNKIRSDGQIRMEQSRLQHEQKMAMRQRSFQAHMNRMKDMSNAQDASFNSYMNNLRSSGTSYASGSGYTAHDREIDAIWGRETFHNPDTGHNVQLDGYYDHTYTDGYGNFLRTDDPSFEPSALTGDWSETFPLQP